MEGKLVDRSTSEGNRKALPAPGDIDTVNAKLQRSSSFEKYSRNISKKRLFANSVKLEQCYKLFYKHWAVKLTKTRLPLKCFYEERKDNYMPYPDETNH